MKIAEGAMRRWSRSRLRVVRVTLSPEDLRRVRRVAGAFADHHRGGTGRFGAPDDDSLNYLGLLGECATAKALGVEWDGGPVGVYTLRDVGPYQVRTTTLPGGSLIVHPEDRSYDAFVFALVVDQDAVEIRGWMWGADAQSPEYWRTQGVRHPAFFVPQSRLHHLETLPSIMELALLHNQNEG